MWLLDSWWYSFVPGANYREEWCLRPRLCIVSLYWAGENLRSWDEFCNESCPWCRIDRWIWWPAPLHATTVPRIPPTKYRINSYYLHSICKVKSFMTELLNIPELSFCMCFQILLFAIPSVIFSLYAASYLGMSVVQWWIAGQLVERLFLPQDNKIHLISPGCSRPSIILQCWIVAYS